MNRAEQKCIQEEMEYREWKKAPLWYCVKTVLHSNGKMESEIAVDEETKLAIVIQSDEKPLDGVFEKNGSTTYYTYHRGYEEARRQMRLATA